MSRYVTALGADSKGTIEQLLQLLELTSDGDIIHKGYRDYLKSQGLCQKIDGGWNIITEEGVQILYKLGLIHP